MACEPCHDANRGVFSDARDRSIRVPVRVLIVEDGKQAPKHDYQKILDKGKAIFGSHRMLSSLALIHCCLRPDLSV